MNDTFSELVVVKRSGQRVNFNGTKIALAIKLAFDDLCIQNSEQDVNKIYEVVLKYIEDNYCGRKTINVEDIQDIIENTLKDSKYIEVYEAFKTYRLSRAASREAFSIKQQHKFVKAIEKIGLAIKNGNNDIPISKVSNFGKIISDEFTRSYLLETKYNRLHDEGNIYIHGIPYYALGITSSSILDLSMIKVNYYNNYFDEIIYTIVNIKKEQYGEQVLANLDYVLRKPIIKKFDKIFIDNLIKYLNLEGFINYIDISLILENISKKDTILLDMAQFKLDSNRVKDIFTTAYNDSINEIEKYIESNMERLLFKLNDLDFSINNNKVTISLGSNEDYESCLINKIYLNILNKLDKLDNVITIYKYDKDVSQKGVIDILSQLIVNKKNIYLSFIEHGSKREIFSTGVSIDYAAENVGRILLSTTTVNLVRLGLKHRNDDLNNFFKDLDNVMELTKTQLLLRYEQQANMYKESFKCLFNNDLLLDDRGLESHQKVKKVLKNGILNIGYVGLTECVKYLLNKEELDSGDLKYCFEIIKHMKDNIDNYSIENKIKFVLSETYDHKVNKELLGIDKSIYGINGNINEYSSFYSSFNTKNIDETLDALEKQQSYSSALAGVCIKGINNKKVVDTINKMIKANIKYGRIVGL